MFRLWPRYAASAGSSQLFDRQTTEMFDGFNRPFRPSQLEVVPRTIMFGVATIFEQNQIHEPNYAGFVDV